MAETDTYLEIRNRLFDEIVQLTDLWQQYKDLFMTSSARVQRLNEHARWFFATVQRVFLNDLIIGISRITDPASFRGKKNVTLAALLEDPRVVNDPSLAQSLSEDLEAAMDAAAVIRKHRHKRVAHLDYAIAFGFEPLPKLKLADIGLAISRLQQIHDRYGVAVLERGASYDLHAFGSAKQLAATLEIAPTFREHQLKEELEDLRRLRDGDPSADLGNSGQSSV